jgi:hypothetical protein
MSQIPPTCIAFETLVNEVLDGAQPESLLATTPHVLSCASCQETAHAAQLFLALDWPTPSVPVGFADRVLDRERVVAHARSQRRRTILAIAASLAATVAVVVTALPTNTSPTSAPLAKAEVTPRIDDSIAQARSALISLTKRTADESFVPAQRLFAAASPPQVKPTATRVVEVTAPPTTAFAPVTNTTKRAFDLFVRDIGGLAGVPKRNF